MIYESAKDYLSGKVILVYDEDESTTEEIVQYVETYYGFTPKSIFVDQPDEGFGGYPNPGSVHCFAREGAFD